MTSPTPTKRSRPIDIPSSNHPPSLSHTWHHSLPTKMKTEPDDDDDDGTSVSRILHTCKIRRLSTRLSTRLTYASFKLDQNWASHSFDEIEHLYQRKVEDDERNWILSNAPPRTRIHTDGSDIQHDEGMEDVGVDQPDSHLQESSTLTPGIATLTSSPSILDITTTPPSTARSPPTRLLSSQLMSQIKSLSHQLTPPATFRPFGAQTPSPAVKPNIPRTPPPSGKRSWDDEPIPTAEDEDHVHAFTAPATNSASSTAYISPPRSRSIKVPSAQDPAKPTEMSTSASHLQTPRTLSASLPTTSGSGKDEAEAAYMMLMLHSSPLLSTRALKKSSDGLSTATSSSDSQESRTTSENHSTTSLTGSEVITNSGLRTPSKTDSPVGTSPDIHDPNKGSSLGLAKAVMIQTPVENRNAKTEIAIQTPAKTPTRTTGPTPKFKLIFEDKKVVRERTSACK